MTSFSRNTNQRDSSNGFSNYFDSKYPINSRSNFTFHEFPSQTNLIDDSLIKRFQGFSQKVIKYSNNVLNRLNLCSKDVQQLQRGLQQKVTQDSGNYHSMEHDVQNTTSVLIQQCQELCEQKKKTQDEECRWMSKQLTEIKNGFKDIQLQRKQQIKAKLNELQQQISEVKVSLQKQKIVRDEISESQIQQFGQQILKIQQMLSLQRQYRIENNNELLKEIEIMAEDIQKLLDTERQTREKKESLFTTLLEQTYLKLQHM